MIKYVEIRRGVFAPSDEHPKNVTLERISEILKGDAERSQEPSSVQPTNEAPAAAATAS